VRRSLRSIGILISPLVAIGAGFAAQGAPGGTLLIYDSITKPFSMEDEVEPVAILLTRFDRNLQRREAKAVQASEIESASHIVLVGTSGFPALDSASLEALRSTKSAVMAVGGAAPFAAGEIPSSRSRAEARGEGAVRYLGTRWAARVDPWFPVKVDSARILAAVVSGQREWPLCFRFGNRFGFAALPSDPPLSMVFSDVLVDFYEIPEPPAASILFVVEDFHPGCSASSMRRLVDYFSHQGIPFAVSTQMQSLPEGVEPMTQEEYFETLRYAESHGGRIFLKGGEGTDSSLKYLEAGLTPAGVADAVQADPSAIHIGRIFYRRTPGEEPVPFPLHTPLRLENGGWLWPANVRGGLDGVHHDVVRSQVRRIVSFRGGLAGVVIPAWLPFQSMRDLIDAARSVEVSVADPLKSVPAFNPLQP
jgi:hypothetical protein